MLARSFVMHEDFTAGGGLLQGVQADDEHVTVVQLFGCSQRGAALGGGVCRVHFVFFMFIAAGRVGNSGVSFEL